MYSLSASCAPRRCSLELVAPDGPLLVVERGAVPGLDEHAYAADDQIGAAPHPGRRLAAGPHVVGQRGGLVAADVVRPVLEAHEVAGRRLVAGRRRGPPEA